MRKKDLKKEEIEHVCIKGFNRSSKILEHKLGINAARLLNTFIYKHNHWLFDERESPFINGKRAFFITIPNLQVETNLTKEPIQKAIKKLVAENLIEVHKKGMPSKNYYIVNGKAINDLENDHAAEYQKWCESIYKDAINDRKRFDTRTKNTPETACLSQLTEKPTTSELKSSPHVSDFSSVTNNKITNNKKTKNFTNRINAVLKKCDLSVYDDKLIILIDNVRYADNDDERSICNMELFNFLCKIVPPFEKFNLSEQDYELIKSIRCSQGHSFQISYKILRNAEAILDKRKVTRFGNLFVGLKEINMNCELRFG